MSDNSGSVTAPTDDAEVMALLEVIDTIIRYGVKESAALRAVVKIRAALTRLQERAERAEARYALVARELDEQKQLPLPETHVLLAKANNALTARAERAEDRVKKLLSALDRTERNFRAAVNGRPVRDMDETLAENDAARALIGESAEPQEGV